jgi:NAD dependent epimerase/dehydratase
VRIVISGAGGFIGSHLAEAAVRAGHDVRAIVNYNSRGDHGHVENVSADVRAALDVRAVDIRDPEAVYACCEGTHAIFHLAALIGIPYSYVAPSSYVGVNAGGTLNFLNAARRLGIARMVHTSTSEVYGSAQYVPIDEKHPLVGQSPYSASKIAADKLAESYALSFALPVTIIRPFNTYGPRQSLRAIIPTIASQLLDESVETVSVGSLDPVRDFTYVADTAQAYLHALERPVAPGTVINLGTGQGHAIREVFEKLELVTGVSKPVAEDAVRVRPPRSEVQRLVSDNTLARAMLGWVPTVAFEDGLARTVEYLRAHRPERPRAYHI